MPARQGLTALRARLQNLSPKPRPQGPIRRSQEAQEAPGGSRAPCKGLASSCTAALQESVVRLGAARVHRLRRPDVELERIDLGRPLHPRLAMAHGAQFGLRQRRRALAGPPVLARLHGQQVLVLVVADVAEDVQQRLARRSPRHCSGALTGLELVEVVQVPSDVVLDGDRRRGDLRQDLSILFHELRVRDEGVLLDQVREVVRELGLRHEEEHDEPVVHDRRVLGGKAVEPRAVAAQRLHDEEVVQLVVFLRAVDVA
mmetsp:Transcript_103224/g.266859  ORF Transcript_103224/g.266859 Transcript_103224/m.266859 type:complete len:258 (-) Transcript_103224:593-1366(-)